MSALCWVEACFYLATDNNTGRILKVVPAKVGYAGTRPCTALAKDS